MAEVNAEVNYLGCWVAFAYHTISIRLKAMSQIDIPISIAHIPVPVPTSSILRALLFLIGAKYSLSPKAFLNRK